MVHDHMVDLVIADYNADMGKKLTERLNGF